MQAHTVQHLIHDVRKHRYLPKVEAVSLPKNLVQVWLVRVVGLLGLYGSGEQPVASVFVEQSVGLHAKTSTGRRELWTQLL